MAVIRLSWGRWLVNLLPVAQRTNDFTIGIVEDTSSIPLRTFLLEEMLARASCYKHVSLGPQDLVRSLGTHVWPYTQTRQPIRPKDPAVPRGEECCKAYPGLGNRSIFYPGSSAGSTITWHRPDTVFSYYVAAAYGIILKLRNDGKRLRFHAARSGLFLYLFAYLIHSFGVSACCTSWTIIFVVCPCY